ncbi:hypothetical protein [Paenibacillus apii]|uniref:hypothetical protein n=1 Tax=Paenibacillus apii TaxID=1850370 RepID=UPI00143A780B|nr:hypothetical protein [Paenibacillus apii]NJJ38405.1 hypothetical protein [Paenibacillus apii]
MQYQIRYVLDPHTLNIIASLTGTRQQLAINPRAFRKLAGVSERAVLGSLPVSSAVAAEIGFIIPDEKGANANERLHPASVSA